MTPGPNVRFSSSVTFNKALLSSPTTSVATGNTLIAPITVASITTLRSAAAAVWVEAVLLDRFTSTLAPLTARGVFHSYKRFRDHMRDPRTDFA